jgi:ABC-2 type transport system permease protein
MRNTLRFQLDLAWLDIKLYVRESVAVLWTFVMPIVVIVGFGVFLPKFVKIYYGPIIVPGICTVMLLSSSLMGSLGVLVETREFGVYQTLALMGAKPIDVMVMYLLSRGVLSFLMVCVLLLLGAIFFPMQIKMPLGDIVLLVLATALGSFMLFNLAITMSLFFKSGSTAHVVGLSLAGVMIFLGGCYFDVAFLPARMRMLAYLTPVYHLNELFRIQVGASHRPLESFLVVIAYSAILLITNLLFFNTRRRRHD